MDSQFNAINAMNQAVMGWRGGCGGHMRQQQTFQPVLVRGVPTMTTPSAVMQRLASARFGDDILRALIEVGVLQNGPCFCCVNHIAGFKWSIWAMVVLL